MYAMPKNTISLLLFNLLCNILLLSPKLSNGNIIKIKSSKVEGIRLVGNVNSGER